MRGFIGDGHGPPGHPDGARLRTGVDAERRYQHFDDSTT